MRLKSKAKEQIEKAIADYQKDEVSFDYCQGVLDIIDKLEIITLEEAIEYQNLLAVYKLDKD